MTYRVLAVVASQGSQDDTVASLRCGGKKGTACCSSLPCPRSQLNVPVSVHLLGSRANA